MRQTVGNDTWTNTGTYLFCIWCKHKPNNLCFHLTASVIQRRRKMTQQGFFNQNSCHKILVGFWNFHRLLLKDQSLRIEKWIFVHCSIRFMSSVLWPHRCSSQLFFWISWSIEATEWSSDNSFSDLVSLYFVPQIEPPLHTRTLISTTGIYKVWRRSAKTNFQVLDKPPRYSDTN